MPDAEIVKIREMLATNPRPPDLASRRQRLDGLSALYPMPGDVRITPADANGIEAEWTETPGADPSRVILYLHGGGYVSGSIASHRQMVVEAGRQAGARTLALNYRLAPENPFPAAVNDALAGYHFLLSHDFRPEQIVVAGDSAGGGLTFATLILLRDAKEPLPACAWCVSPWVDLEGLGASMDAKAASDPMIQKPYVQELAADYLHGADPRTPAAAPLYASLNGLPPLLIQVGSAETLLDDAIRIAGAAGAADVRVTLEVWPEMIHVWHLFHPQLSAGRQALASAGRFIRQHTG